MSLPGPGRILWDRVVALLLLAFAVYIVVVAQRLTYMQGRVPGPGFAPLWIGAGMGVAALAILAGTWMPRFRDRTRPALQPEEEAPPAVRPSRLLAIGALTVTAVALIDRVGMLTALGLMLLAFLRILRGSWQAAVATAVGLPLLFYLLFALWLKVPLPRGPWGF